MEGEGTGFLSTPEQYQKGRLKAAKVTSKFTLAEATAVTELHDRANMTVKDIATRFHVSVSTIRRIINGQTKIFKDGAV